MRSIALFALALGLWLLAASAAAQPGPSNALVRATVDVLAGRTPRTRAVVLDGDGRLVAPLGAVESVNDLRVRYPDGRVDRLRLVASDAAWGVALLEGNAGHWPHGLALAEREPRSGARVAWTAAVRTRAAEGRLARRRSLVGRGGALLRDAWELTPTPPVAAAGSAIMDVESRAVIGLVMAFGPSPDGGVSTTPFGVPLAVLRALRSRAGELQRPWIGLVARDLRAGEHTTSASQGILVTEVHPEGPAFRAGLRAGPGGDVIVGVDEHPVRSLEDLGNALADRRPGDVVTVRVLRGGVQVGLPLVLEALRPASPVRM